MPVTACAARDVFVSSAAWKLSASDAPLGLPFSKASAMCVPCTGERW
jgi:hypothetical protein